MSDSIEQKCISKGVKLTDQRKIIVRVISESKKSYGESDHPDVDELYNRVSKIDPKISIATVYRTVKLLEEAGILAKHDFKGGKARYEAMIESHHDHLIDVKTGEIIEFVDDEIEDLLTTSTLKEMVRAIKREYCVSSYGVFSLQYSDGMEFYEDTEEINVNDEETQITLEEFFGNADGAEIIYGFFQSRFYAHENALSLCAEAVDSTDINFFLYLIFKADDFS